MPADRTWTIDSLAHAIPAPELRQEFLREAHLATLEELPAIFTRWGALVGQHEAARPELDALLAYAKEHGGRLPEQYADDGGTDEWLAGFRKDLRQADAA